jgi:hypothetical protein
VSTRKLILTAIACGLAILIAGGAFLLRTAQHRDELTVTNAAVGQSRTVAGVDASVLSWSRVGRQILVSVSIAVKPSAASVAADAPWTMLVGTKLAAEAPVGLHPDEVACRGLVVAPGTSTICVLAFTSAEGSPFLAFALNGAQEQWRLAS